MATDRELAKWLAQGNGEVTDKFSGAPIVTSFTYYDRNVDEEEFVSCARKWSDKGWHKPTIDYMFGEEPV